MGRSLELSVGEFYHLYNRGVEKRKIYLDKRDHLRFIVLLYVANNSESIHVSNYEDFSRTEFFSLPRGNTLVDIGAYCLMPNHFHLLVREKEERGTSTFMQKLLTGYTMYFNKKYERKGTLFEGPFRASHAQDDKYLKYLFSYIHLNPIKLIDPNWKISGIKEKKEASVFLSDFDYSSYGDYTGKERPQKAILNFSAFPEYFETVDEFRTMIHEWLSLSRQGKALP